MHNHFTAGEKTIMSSLVKCVNANGESTCDWEGPLYMVSIHAQSCQFAVVPCENQCRDENGKVRMIRKGENAEHLRNNCPYRDYKCDICGETGAYSSMVHGKACERNTLACPNVGCTEVVRAQRLAAHLVVCKHTLVPCKFRGIGCGVTLKRMHISWHEEGIKVHLAIALDKIVELHGRALMLKVGSIQIVRSAADLGMKMEHASKHTAELQKSIEIGLQKVRRQSTTRSRIALWIQSKAYQALNKMGDTTVFKITNVRRDNRTVFMSSPFYSRQGHQSYHMAVSVHLNNTTKSISVYASIVPGKFDQYLSWPFIGNIHFVLLNQHHDGGHHSMVMAVSAADNMRLGTTPLGFPHFISLGELLHNSDPNKQFFLDDTLYFQITIVNKDNGSLLCSI